MRQTQCNTANMTGRTPRRANDLGPIGEYVARNVRKLREDRELSTTKLAERLKDLGRPIGPTAITRLEAGQRRVDTDDLVALAIALGVSPNRLLLPAERADDERDTVALTPNKSSEWHLAWRWAAGDQPLLTHEEAADMDFIDSRVREFSEENQPYLGPIAREVYRQLVVRFRLRPPFRYTIWFDGKEITSSATMGGSALRSLAEHEAERAEQEAERAELGVDYEMTHEEIGRLFSMLWPAVAEGGDDAGR